MKKILLGAGIIICALSIALAVQVNQKNTTKISKLLAKNIQALAMNEKGNENGGGKESGEGGLDTSYIIHDKTCSISAEGKASVKIKWLGNIVEIPAGGSLVIDGRVDCEGGGNFACTPVKCSELYETVF